MVLFVLQDLEAGIKSTKPYTSPSVRERNIEVDTHCILWGISQANSAADGC